MHNILFASSEAYPYAKTGGLADVVGGEVTLRKDLTELVSYARELGFVTIQIQTNGRMFAYRQNCEELVAAGGRIRLSTTTPRGLPPGRCRKHSPSSPWPWQSHCSGFTPAPRWPQGLSAEEYPTTFEAPGVSTGARRFQVS